MNKKLDLKNIFLCTLITGAIAAFCLYLISSNPYYPANFYTVNIKWPLRDAITNGWSDNKEFASNFMLLLETTLIMILGFAVGKKFLKEVNMNVKKLLLFSFGAGVLRILLGYSELMQRFRFIRFTTYFVLESILLTAFSFAVYYLLARKQASQEEESQAPAVKRSYYPSFKIIAAIWFIADTALALVIMNFLDFATISHFSIAGVFAVILTGAPFSLLYTYLYFLPYLHAHKKQHRQTRAIYILNIFAGWTFLAWIIALIWSCTVPGERKVIQQTVPSSNADEILKYKALFDSGVITQEEFEKKKQELLQFS